MVEFFDLQLFNGEDGDSGATQGDSGSRAPVEKVALDEEGQVRVLPAEEEAGPEPEGGTRGGEQAYYSPDEVRATDFVKLDPGRIPQELMPWYKSMQAGFTRKTQELAAQRRAVQMALEQAKAGTPAQEGAANPQGAYVQEVARAAREQVERYFGAGYDEFNPAHQAAMTLAVQQMYADTARAAEQQAALVGLEAELMAEEPNYEAVYEYAKARVAELPHREYVRLQEAFASGDVRTLRGYYEAARRSFYAQRQGVRRGEATGPAPRLEGAGSGAVQVKAPPNYAELGRLQSFDDKLAWLRRHNIKP